MSSDVTVLAMPYDSGQLRRRMGRGPEAFLEAGLATRLSADGRDVEVRTIEASSRFPTELSTPFDLNRQLAVAVRDAASRSAFPLVLSGNCIGTTGALAGLGIDDLAVLWFDAHGDFNTPDSTRTGFLDGMALSVVCGLAFDGMAAGIPGFRPLPASRVVLAGTRDFDPGERERFEAAGGGVGEPEVIARDGAVSLLRGLRGRASRLYVHLDLDVLDPSEGIANGYPTPGGLLISQVAAMIAFCRSHFRLVGATLSSYDPTEDTNQAVLRAGLDFAVRLAG
jgi:arginase